MYSRSPSESEIHVCDKKKRTSYLASNSSRARLTPSSRVLALSARSFITRNLHKNTNIQWMPLLNRPGGTCFSSSCFSFSRTGPSCCAILISCLVNCTRSSSVAASSVFACSNASLSLLRASNISLRFRALSRRSRCAATFS